jgi:hypothetical protein
MAEDSENEAGLRIIPASEILDKIQKGEPVKYDHIKIKGELDLSELDLPTEHVARTEHQIENLKLPEESKVVSSSINITNSEFDSKVNFGNNLFRCPVSFDNTTFREYADFSVATFCENANFSKATFKDTKYRSATFSEDGRFWDAMFSVDAGFWNARFGENASFMSATFSKDANFSATTFSGIANFLRATFSKDANFSAATFSGIASFGAATFEGTAGFENATFSGDTGFMNATFSGIASFEEATFSGNTSFSAATFSRDARFDGATFSEIAEFTAATFSGDANFIYSKFQNNSVFSKSRFDKFANFKGSIFGEDSILSLNEIDFEKIYLDWNSIRDLNRDLDGSVYLSLMASYKTRGFFEDADDCYYQYRIERRRAMSAPYKFADGIYKFPDWILMALYGYGVKPLRPLAGLVIVLVAFSLLYSYLGIAGNTPVDAFNTSSTILLSGSQLIGTPTYPTPGLLPYWIFTFEKLLGSLLFGLILISIGRTIVR